MKKYLVAEIPPYCQQRESADVKDEDRETGESKEGAFEEKIFPSGERESAEVMDCLSSLDRNTDGHGGTDTIFV